MDFCVGSEQVAFRINLKKKKGIETCCWHIVKLFVKLIVPHTGCHISIENDCVAWDRGVFTLNVSVPHTTTLTREDKEI